MEFYSLVSVIPRQESRIKTYEIYTIQEGNFRLTNKKISKLNHENLMMVFDEPNCIYCLYAKKKDFTYEYFLNNPLDLKPIDLEGTQNITRVFTDEQFNHLKFLKKIS